MTELSPTAQAVVNAIDEVRWDWGNMQEADATIIAAAALRAAADQVVPDEPWAPRRGMRPGGTGALTPEEGAEDQQAATRRRFLAIAAELEAQ